MKWFVNQHGDDLEKSFFSNAEGSGSFPSYRKTWSIFIGRASQTSAADLLNKYSRKLIDAKDAIRVTRDNFAKYHYTAFESFLALAHLKDPEIGNFDNNSHFETLNFIVLHHAYAGRIGEALNNCLSELIGKERQNLLKFSDCVKAIQGGRNIIIHGAHPPIHIASDGGIYFVPPRTDSITVGWDDKSSVWAEFADLTEYVSLREYHNERILEIEKKMNICLDIIFEAVFRYMEKHNLVIASTDQYGIASSHGRSGMTYPEDSLFPGITGKSSS